MILHRLKDITNSFRRSPVGSGINVFGMSVGIAIFLLIMLFIKTELSVNRNNPNYSDIYRISTGKKEIRGQKTNALIGPKVKSELPEVKEFLRIDFVTSHLTGKVGNEVFDLGRLVYADSSLFRVFPFEFILGDKQRCLADPLSIVLTESLSKKLFGSINPIGQQFLLENKYQVLVTGVIKDLDRKTHFEAQAFLSFQTMPIVRQNPELFNCRGCWNYETYLLLQKGSNKAAVEAKLNNILNSDAKKTGLDQSYDQYFSLNPLLDVYFQPEERPEFRKGNLLQMRIFFAIGLVILVMALINYINLATAQSGSRIKELALRKTMGATRGNLISLILAEAVFMAIISMNIGLVLLEFLKPVFNEILSLDLSIGYQHHPQIILGFLSFGVIFGLIAGIYPALYITRFDTARTLQEIIQKSGSMGKTRKILTAIQLIASMVLIACTLIISLQLRYTQKKDLGFDKDLLVYTPVNRDINPKKESYRQELLSYPGISEVSYSYGSYRLDSERWSFDSLGKRIILHIEEVDEHYIKTLGLDIIEGRNFFGAGDQGHILINETARKAYFGEHPIGILVKGIGDRSEIIGVVKDFSFQSLHSVVEPMAIIYNPDGANLCNIRLSPNAEIPRVIAHLEKTWKFFSPNFPLEYHFVDDLYEQKYRKELQNGQLFFFFSIVSLLIAFLGIFGLITFSVSKRSKEIGIRKVNGASVGDILWLLSKDMSSIVWWAMIPATGIAGYLMTRWLSNFAFRIHMPYWVFLVSILLVWGIVMLATLLRSLKAARANPASIMRNQ